MLRWLKKAIRRTGDVPWPEGVPELYPDLSTLKLCRFLSKEEYERIRSMRRVVIAPFYDEHSSAEERLFGKGLQKLLIRDLRLHRDISVLGPEDSPDVCLQEFDPREQDPEAVVIGGAIRFEGDCYGGYYHVLEAEMVMPVEVREADLIRFIEESNRMILATLGLVPDAVLLEKWRSGRPREAAELIAVGEIQDLPKSAMGELNGPKFERVMELFGNNPAFPLPLHEIMDECEVPVEDFLAALWQDPDDVQVMFLLHNRLWTGQRSDFGAFQFLRLAIELCPGHGKAHMVVCCSAAEETDTLPHTELGCYLLPYNSFAITNYLNHVLEKKVVLTDFSLVYHAVTVDPDDLQPYWHGIELLKKADRLAEALELALHLEKVAEPPLSERTIYTISQNPERYAEWKSGAHDPFALAQAEVAKLKQELQMRPGKI